jgi:hypothetical protein
MAMTQVTIPVRGVAMTKEQIQAVKDSKYTESGGKVQAM